MSTTIASTIPLTTKIRAASAGITALIESSDDDGETITCYTARGEEVAYVWHPKGSPFWYARSIFNEPLTFRDRGGALSHVVNGPPYTQQPGYLCGTKAGRAR